MDRGESAEHSEESAPGQAALKSDSTFGVYNLQSMDAHHFTHAPKDVGRLLQQGRFKFQFEEHISIDQDAAGLHRGSHSATEGLPTPDHL